jgi:hypothetical protein
MKTGLQCYIYISPLPHIILGRPSPPFAIYHAISVVAGPEVLPNCSNSEAFSSGDSVSNILLKPDITPSWLVDL